MNLKRVTVIYVSLLMICAAIFGIAFAMKKSEPASESSAAVSLVTESLPPEDRSSPASVPTSESGPESQTQSEPSSAEESSEEPQDTVVSFLACPDNIIHPSAYYDALIRFAKMNGIKPDYKKLATTNYDFASVYEYVAPAIANADIAYVNVETLIGGDRNGISGYPMFNTPEAAGTNLIDLGFDIFNLAHNHMLDSGNDKYLINCDNFFKSAGKTTTGYYKNKADTENITVYTKDGIRIALLAYTFSTNGVSLSSSAKTYIPYFDEVLVKKQVALAKSMSDFIIVSCHWGNEDTYLPNSLQKKYASLLLELNVDVILGMHPHVIQPMSIETRADGGRTLLVYSLGNFVSGMQDGFNMLGGMLSFDIVRSAMSGDVSFDNVCFTPIVTHYIYGQKVNSDDTGHRDYKIYYLKDYTKELAATHGCCIWDKTHEYTLYGGGFSVENLMKTVEKIIPAEFLPNFLQY